MSLPPRGPLTPHHVLLVEDDPLVSGVLTKVLQRAGYAVQFASHGAEALNLLDIPQRPDVVIMDFNLPGTMTAAEVARRMWARVAQLPIICLTGDAVAARQTDIAFRAVVNKADGPMDLLDAVRDVLSGQRSP